MHCYASALVCPFQQGKSWYKDRSRVALMRSGSSAGVGLLMISADASAQLTVAGASVGLLPTLDRVGQEGAQFLYGPGFGTIEHRPSGFLRRDQSGCGQDREVGGHAVGRHLHLPGDLASGHPVRKLVDEAAVHLEAGRLRQRTHHLHCFDVFHT